MPHVAAVQPQLKHPEDCAERAPTDGTNDFFPTTRIAPHLRYGGTPGPVQLVDLDYFPYTARDGAGNIERAVGRYRTGPIRIERPSLAACIYFSSNGGSLVDFGVGGTVDIIGGAGGHEFRTLTGNDQGQRGGVYQTASHSYTRRAIANTAEFLSLANGDGVAGPPSFSAGYDVLRRSSGASTGQRTMTPELILAALTMKFSGASLSIRGNDDTDALKATYVSGTNYTLQGGVGGVLRKLLTVLDYPLFDSGESTASNNTDVRTGTTCSVVIPSTGTYMLFAVGMLQAQITLNFSVSASPAASVLCELQQDDGGGGGFITKNEADYTRSVASGFSGAVDSESGAIFVGYPLPTAAVAGRTYQYRLNATVPTASGGGSGSFACSGTQRHFCAVLALKTGG